MGYPVQDRGCLGSSSTCRVDCLILEAVQNHSLSAKQRNEMLEETTAHAVIAHLLAEGRSVTNLQRVREGRGPSPDFLVTIDGAPVALEVKRYIDQQAAKAEFGVEMLEGELKPLLDSTAAQMQCKLVLDLTFAVEQLQHYGRLDAARDAGLLAPCIVAAARPALDDLVEIVSPIPWLQRPGVFAYYSPAEPSFFIASMAPGMTVHPKAEAWVAWVVPAKGHQHLGHAEAAILAIASEFDETESLVPAFASSKLAIPWWRVYDVSNRGSVRLVHPLPTA
jgi:hypothetical protein